MKCSINVRDINFSIKSENVRRYVNDMNQHPLLSQNEEVDLFEKYQQHGDMKARDTIIKCNQRFVYSVAKKFGNEKNLMDVINEANLGLISAIDSFDTTRGFKFISHAVWYIRAYITQYLAKGNNLVRNPNNSIIPRLNKISDKFYSANGYDIDNEDLLEEFNKNRKTKLKHLNHITNISVNGELPEYVEYGNNDFERDSVNDRVDSEYNAKLVNKMLAILPSKEIEMVKMYYGIGYTDSFSMNQIGDKFGVSSERARQIIVYAVKKLGLNYNKNKKLFIDFDEKKYSATS